MHIEPRAFPPTPRRRPASPPRRTPADRLRTALQELAAGQARIASHREQAWASITFAGTRHRLELMFEGPAGIAAGERFIAELPEHEFDIPRQLVADASVIEVDHRLAPEPRLTVAVELLLLEDG